ncbi:hypothetical protein DET50_11550 [Marinobacter pelagius]|uniref:Uncharacterized protein n=1 Tax=Marinobacter pelagius TaxID=379482 RepID=A0A366GJF6_9GAMM|nr:hypothetical protein DET50_11550 [Marinobacter pelagius]
MLLLGFLFGRLFLPRFGATGHGSGYSSHCSAFTRIVISDFTDDCATCSTTRSAAETLPAGSGCRSRLCRDSSGCLGYGCGINACGLLGPCITFGFVTGLLLGCLTFCRVNNGLLCHGR